MSTALITGASGGIGLEFARIFAEKGCNLILVARNENQLNEIAHELTGTHNIEVKVFACDLSNPDNAKFIYEDLKNKNISVDYLINNAGFGINGEFTEIDWSKEFEMYSLNMITLSYFTKVFARDMKSRNFGRIVNLGSTGSFQPGPFMAGYCATKAFVLNLSEAVNYELKGTNVSVTTLCPGVTDTNFHAVAQTENTWMSKFLSHATSSEVAEYGYKIMMKRKPSGVHGFFNKMMVGSNRFASRNSIIAVAAKILKGKKNHA
jgi:short-subunit dehydrogenase